MNKQIKYDGVVFIGHMAAGKTYYADKLKEELEKQGITAYKVSIAAKLKDVAKDVFGMKEKNRRLLQQLGSKMREIDPDVWIKYLATSIATKKQFPFIVDDVRFMNELSYLLYTGNTQRKLFVVKISPDIKNRIKKYKEIYGREPTEIELNDPTETEIDSLPFDYEIKNIYNETEGEKEIQVILEKIFD